MYRLVVALLAILSTFDADAYAGGGADEKVTLAVFGDWPYSQAQFDNASLLVNSINADPAVSRVIFVGDIHSGDAPCTGAGLHPAPAGADPGWNRKIYDIFQRFRAPLVYTPGDNEWADCSLADEKKSGAPLSELSGVRSLFFARPGRALGQTDMAVSTQAENYDPRFPSDSQFVENVAWEDAGVVFVAINLPGANDDHLPWRNGFENSEAQAREIRERNDANLRWLDAAFQRAKAGRKKAVVIAFHADMWSAAELEPGGDGLSAYTPFVQHLAQQALAFGKPVLLLNGDSHLYLRDKPLADPNSSTGVIHHAPAVPNLTRIVVQGSTNTPAEWLRLTIDPAATEIFEATNVVYCTDRGSFTCQ